MNSAPEIQSGIVYTNKSPDSDAGPGQTLTTNSITANDDEVSSGTVLSYRILGTKDGAGAPIASEPFS